MHTAIRKGEGREGVKQLMRERRKPSPSTNKETKGYIRGKKGRTRDSQEGGQEHA